MRVGEAEGDPEGDGRRTLTNGWDSRLWRLEDKHFREGSSVRQFGRPRPLRIRHRRRRSSTRSVFEKQSRPNNLDSRDLSNSNKMGAKIRPTCITRQEIKEAFCQALDSKYIPIRKR